MRWLVALLVLANIVIFTFGRDRGPGPERVEVAASPEVGNLRLLSEVSGDGTAKVPPSTVETGQKPVSENAEVPSFSVDASGRPPVATGRAPSAETAIDGSANE